MHSITQYSTTDNMCHHASSLLWLLPSHSLLSTWLLPCTPPGPAFYRAESTQGRDLAVLAAAVHRRQTGRLHVLDVMAGSGVRGARYLQQVGRCSRPQQVH